MAKGHKARFLDLCPSWLHIQEATPSPRQIRPVTTRNIYRPWQGNPSNPISILLVAPSSFSAARIRAAPSAHLSGNLKDAQAFILAALHSTARWLCCISPQPTHRTRIASIPCCLWRRFHNGSLLRHHRRTTKLDDTLPNKHQTSHRRPVFTLDSHNNDNPAPKSVQTGELQPAKTREPESAKTRELKSAKTREPKSAKKRGGHHNVITNQQCLQGRMTQQLQPYRSRRQNL